MYTLFFNIEHVYSVQLTICILCNENVRFVYVHVYIYTNRMCPLMPTHIVSGSAHLLLPPLSKLLYQLTEESTISEVTGIPSSSGSLNTPAILLRGVLSLLLGVSESKPESLAKSLGHVKACVGSVVVESVRVGSLSSVSCDHLPTMEVIVDTVMRAQVNHVKVNPDSRSSLVRKCQQ